MRHLIVSLCVVTLGLVVGCSKSGSSGGSTGGTTGGFSFANTDYSGLMIQQSRQFPKPILIHFNADSTLIDYCLFYLDVNGTWIDPDSVIGKIISVTANAGSGPSVKVYLKATADTQVYTFTSDMSGLTGGSAGVASNQFTLNTLTKLTGSAVSISNTSWYTDTTKSNDATNGALYYPESAWSPVYKEIPSSK